MFDRILGHLSDIANEFKISPASHFKAKANNEYINIAHLFTTLEQLFYDQAIEKGVMLHTEAVDIEVDAPAIIVLRILTNLVGNALEHSKAKDIVVNAKKRFSTNYY
jgi:signal transduction histidine kinase